LGCPVFSGFYSFSYIPFIIFRLWILRAGRSSLIWAEVGGKGKEGLFWGSKIPHKNGRKPTLVPAPLLRLRLSSYEGIPIPK
jgi:hypothetical protein